MKVHFRIGTAEEGDVKAHLTACDGEFVPPLSERVDLAVYSRKIRENAVTFEAWDGQLLVGLVGAYLNATSAGRGFISNVSVLSGYSNKGIGAELLRMCFEHARKCGICEITLQVSPKSIRALELYRAAGFRVTDSSGDQLFMGRSVEPA